MNPRFKIPLLALASLAALLTGPNALAAANKTEGRPARSSVERACSLQESWKFGVAIPPFWVNRLANPFSEDGQPDLGLIPHLELLKTVGKAEEIRVFADYWVNRLFLQAGLVRLAHDGFARIVSGAPSSETEGIRTAALDCLSAMETKYPTLSLSHETLQKMSSLSKKRSYLDVVARTALIRMSEKESSKQDPILNELLVPLKGSAHEALIRSLLAAETGNEKELIRYSSLFLRSAPLPPFLRSQLDGLYLLLGRARHGRGEYQRAIASYKRIRNTSNYFGESMLSMSWAQLMKASYADAVGSSQNMVLGGLRDVFAPDADLIVAIALNETCHFPEALESIRFFRRSYGPAHRWLKTWASATPTRPSLYPLLVSYMKKKKSPVPDRIATEWIRSPIFLSAQKELNEIQTEREQIRRLSARFSKSLSRPKDKRMIGVRTSLLARFDGFKPWSKTREVELVSRIESDLRARTQRMRTQLQETIQNIQLVEAEVYNAAGEKMIADYSAPSSDRAPADSNSAKSAARKGPVWDWGKFDADEADPEIWEDELGFLETDLTSKCVPK